ncbi:hypothetical protein CONPUDRAFT_71140 [Coniophora puteana RWD-64-598 SS2]|uniref:Uncharacterized protein n=1 Tax=Coniophora puteana (strain RWD-64-598) TaxID=741705 RepID=A0A5M3MYY7_CONPW|nr:uncharacterized protein CONPUDRAFT_71140 [Coniophora puteana RWD-64-598 SS2]EIW84352.1 hypothetical protein CONPUDRAFT_71140 [Coniophora puteana RWD-64-598 SS2]
MSTVWLPKSGMGWVISETRLRPDYPTTRLRPDSESVRSVASHKVKWGGDFLEQAVLSGNTCVYGSGISKSHAYISRGDNQRSAKAPGALYLSLPRRPRARLLDKLHGTDRVSETRGDRLVQMQLVTGNTTRFLPVQGPRHAKIIYSLEDVYTAEAGGTVLLGGLNVVKVLSTAKEDLEETPFQLITDKYARWLHEDVQSKLHGGLEAINGLHNRNVDVYVCPFPAKTAHPRDTTDDDNEDSGGAPAGLGG